MKFWSCWSHLWKLFIGQKNPKVKVELPLEIIELEILPKLPAMSLIRCKCVCKRWKSLILTREFARMNLRHITSDQSLIHHKILEVRSKSRIFSTHDCDDVNNDGSTTIHPLPRIHGVKEGVFILASLDGLVCVALHTSEFAFWNPLTGACKKFNSNSPSFHEMLSDAFGFYFDSSNNDYKLLRVVYSGNSGAYIYSQRSDSWRKIKCLEIHQFRSNPYWSHATFLGQSLYFMVRPSIRDCESWIIGFDVRSEKFRKIHFPPVKPNGVHFCGSLIIVKGCLHLCIAYKNRNNSKENFLVKSEGELWRMDGDGDAWTKVASFSRGQHRPLSFNETCVTTNENWPMILEDNNAFYKIDIEDLATNFEVNDSKNRSHSFNQIIYIETLVSPYF